MTTTSELCKELRDGLHDKRGIPIELGDIVKVFHFIGPRRKRHYMYKQCLGFKGIGPTHDVPYMKFGHLNPVVGERDSYYLEKPDGRWLPDYEIVQSIHCDHEDRPRAARISPVPASKPSPGGAG